MLIQITCEHCRRKIEADGMEKTTFCPYCGRETRVFAAASAAPTPQPSPATARDELDGLIGAGYLTAALLPVVGFIIGVILLAKNRPGSGLAVIVLSLFMGILYAIVLSAMLR
jgi:hypothetical protein